LDRIEDAKHGAALETLETSVTQYEQFLANLEHLYTQLGTHLPTRKGA
jgi:hypothetical protein